MIARVIYRMFHYYLLMATREACYETALNTALLLFSFFPQGDPMGCLLYIPFLALSANRFATVQHLAESGLAIGSLPLILLPNWSFDYALALMKLNKMDKAKEMMRESLLRWPEAVRLIIEHSVDLE